MQATSLRVFRRVGSVSFTRFGEEGLLVVPRNSLNVVLNGTGAAAFELMDGRRTLAQIASLLQDEFDEADRTKIEADLTELFEDLVQKQAIEQVG